MAEDISENFKDTELNCKNNLQGYYDINEVNIPDMPVDAVIAAKNVRFTPQGTEIRPGYSLAYDLAAINAGAKGFIGYADYSIIRTAEKVFVDSDGTSQTVFIAVLRHNTTGRVRVLMNKYYAPKPTDTYRNAWKRGVWDDKWIDGWVDVTERYSGESTATTEEKITSCYYYSPGTEPEPGGYKMNFSAIGSLIMKPQDYFRGWYFVDANGDINGLVDRSDQQSGKAYFKVILSDGAVLVNPSTGQNEFGLVRFRCTEERLADLHRITDVRFETKSANMIRFYTGKGNRTFNLSFIKDRKYFGKYETLDPTFNTGRTTWLTKTADYRDTESITYVKVKCTRSHATGLGTFHRFAFVWKHSGMTDYKQLLDQLVFSNSITGQFEVIGGLIVTLNGSTTLVNVNDEATFVVRNNERRVQYDGFMFDVDSIDIPGKKTIAKFSIADNDLNNDPTEQKEIGFSAIGRELGIRYFAKSYKVRSNTSADSKFRIYSAAIQLDGRQAFFVKNLYTGTHNIVGTGEFHGGLTIDIIFEPWFNPRISAHLLFFMDDLQTDPQFTDSIIPTGKLLEGDGKGFYRIDELPVNIYNSTKAIYGNLITSRGGYNTTETSTYPYDYATGLQLQDYLNNYYWKTVTVGVKAGFPLGENLIGFGTDDESINKDNDAAGDNIGEFSVIFSQVQRGDANTKSVMCTERNRQLSVGMPIVAIMPGMGNEYLVFTKNQVRWDELTDEQGVVTRNIADYYDDGLVNQDAVISAIMPEEVQSGPPVAPYTSKFSGVFAAGYEGFYVFSKNKRYDLLSIRDEQDRVLINKWSELYKELPKSVKEASRVGYNANNREIFWYLNGKVYVWSIRYSHWTIYEFPDTIAGFASEIEGELYFWTGLKIYKTNRVTRDIQKDKGTEVIDWYYTKMFGHGTEQLNKIPQGFDLNYDAELNTSVRDVEAYIDIECGTERGSTNLFDNTRKIKDDGANEYQDHIRQGFDLMTRAKYYTVKIASNAATAGNLVKLKIKELKVRAKVAPGVIEKQ